MSIYSQHTFDFNNRLKFIKTIILKHVIWNVLTTGSIRIIVLNVYFLCVYIKISSLNR